MCDGCCQRYRHRSEKKRKRNQVRKHSFWPSLDFQLLHIALAFFTMSNKSSSIICQGHGQPENDHVNLTKHVLECTHCVLQLYIIMAILLLTI